MFLDLNMQGLFLWNYESVTHIINFCSEWNSQSQVSKRACVNSDKAIRYWPDWPSLMWLLLYLETVGGIKVQLIWEICHSPFIGHCCLRHDWTFGQLEEPVSARSIADVTCKTKSWLNCTAELKSSLVMKSKCYLLVPVFAWSSLL